jgi:DNA polymerase III delta prime subunit
LKRRCFIIELKPLTSKEIAKLLEEIAEEESDEDLNDIIQSIAETCEGSPGIALQMLEDCIHSDNTEKTIEKYRMTKEEVIDLCRLLLKAKKWNEITKKLKLYKESGIDPETLRRAIVGYASSVLLNGDNPKAFLIYDAFERPTYDNGFAQIVGSAYTVFMDPERG